MITDGLIRFMIALTQAAFSLLPPWYPTLTEGQQEALTQSRVFFAYADAFVPVSELFTIVGLTAGATVAWLMLWVYNWFIRRIADVTP